MDPSPDGEGQEGRGFGSGKGAGAARGQGWKLAARGHGRVRGALGVPWVRAGQRRLGGPGGTVTVSGKNSSAPRRVSSIFHSFPHETRKGGEGAVENQRGGDSPRDAELRATGMALDTEPLTPGHRRPRPGRSLGGAEDARRTPGAER